MINILDYTKGTVVNWQMTSSLHEGILEITLTVPFIIFISLWIIKGRKDLYL